MNVATKLLVTAALGLAGAGPASAHHSFAAQYDADKPVTLTGAVTRIEWLNPHIYIYVNVADDETGKVTEYAFEMGSPNTLIRQGWSRNSLKPGDVVTVDGSLARNGEPLVNAQTVVLTATGRRMFAGSSRDTTP